jgi:hypothetical protein
MLPLLLIVVLGVLAVTPRATDEPKNTLNVGASYMTFWGTGMNNDWPTGSVYWPILGNYSSSNASIASQHIKMAISHNITFFLLDYGWGNPSERDLMESAAINGLINASEGTEAAKNFNFCIFYFPDDGISGTVVNKTGLEKDFQHMNETYFKHSSYLRLNGSNVVILADFPKYLKTTTPASEINDEFWNLTEKYELYLVPALWPNWNNDTQCAVLNDSNTRTPPVYSAITLWGDTTIIDWNKTISYSEYFTKTKDNFEKWNKTARQDYGVDFVPFICPGYNNLIYTHMQNLTWWAIVTRNPQVWNDTYQLACLYANSTSNSLHMILIFTWNDFKEGTSIEPTEDYGSTYLNAILLIPEFPSTVLLSLFMVVTLLATIIYRKNGKRS